MLFGWQSNLGAVAWYRLQQPLRTLNEQGYSCAWNRLIPRELYPQFRGGNKELKEKAVVLAQMTAGEKQSELYQQICQEGIVRTCYEMDDDIFSITADNPAHAEMSSPGYRANVSENLRLSHRVIVSRKPLADVARQHTDAPIYVIPNYIPEWLLTHRKPVHTHLVPAEEDSVARSHWKRHATVVGWTGGSNHAMDWQHLMPRLLQWVTREPSAILHFMGTTEYVQQHQREIPPERVTVQGWSESVEAYLRTICFDVGVIPLRQHKFNESKSWIKALEMAALGIPVVASDFGPYHDFVLHGETGFLFRRPGEMAQYLDTLVHDRELRVVMSANARAVAAAHTYEKNAWKWASALLEN